MHDRHIGHRAPSSNDRHPGWETRMHNEPRQRPSSMRGWVKQARARGASPGARRPQLGLG
eukprot:2510210-Prymnesium_polylepis.2